MPGRRGTYMIEASFYRDLAGVTCRCARPSAGTPTTTRRRTPTSSCWRTSRRREQGDQMRGCSPADIEAAIDELVLLHGPRWGDPTLLDIEWLNRSTRDVGADGRAASRWPSCRSASATRTGSTPRRWRCVDRFMPRLADYLVVPAAAVDDRPRRLPRRQPAVRPRSRRRRRLADRQRRARPRRPRLPARRQPAPGDPAGRRRPGSSTATSPGCTPRASRSSATTCGRCTGTTRSAGW